MAQLRVAAVVSCPANSKVIVCETSPPDDTAAKNGGEWEGRSPTALAVEPTAAAAAAAAELAL